jgi:hypothetical protein
MIFKLLRLLMVAVLYVNIKRSLLSPSIRFNCVDPAELTRKLITLETEAGTDPAFLRNLPATVTSFLGPGFLARRIRRIASHLVSPISPSPVISKDLEAWAVKSTSLAAMTFMLGASANGLSTSAMEGFDERRVCYILGIPPERFSVSLIVSLGHAAGSNEMDANNASSATSNTTSATPITSDEKSFVQEFPAKSRRYPLDDVCFGDTYGALWREK